MAPICPACDQPVTLGAQCTKCKKWYHTGGQKEDGTLCHPPCKGLPFYCEKCGASVVQRRSISRRRVSVDPGPQFVDSEGSDSDDLGRVPTPPPEKQKPLPKSIASKPLNLNLGAASK